VIEDLPRLNAVLNSAGALLLLAGYLAIRRKRQRLHAGLMVSALAAAALFLVSYLVYHYEHGATPYAKEDWTRPVYFAVLISHTLLAAANAPLVILTVFHAAKRRFDRHRRIARWTLPIWLYVNVTGVLVYLMLYRW